jgi:WS/DGAT/MGAT family acyltransferase
MLPFVSKNEPLSNVDTAWLRMDDPTNLMMVTALMLFETPMDMERLKATIQHRMLPFSRFRQRVVESRLPMSNPQWEDDPHFDLNSHLHRVALPAPGDQTALQELVSDLMSMPLDYSKPLWQAHIIENYGEGSAILMRLHHCIGDGIALAFVLLSMTDLAADAPWPSAGKEEEKENGGGNPLAGIMRRASSAARSTRETAGKLLEESRETIFNPEKAAELAKGGVTAAAAAARLVLRWPDPSTVFKGKLGVAKRAAWSQPLALADVKRVSKVMGGTINDVLLTAMTGALRRYLEGRLEPVDGLEFRAAVPVNLRPLDEMGELGNRFGLVFLTLPVGIEDPVERLAELKERMDALKDSPEAMVAFGILNAMGMTPGQVQDLLVKMFGTKATAVMTNVPGPKFPLYLAGSRMSGMMFWVPQSGRLGLGVSIFSYAGTVRLGVATDAGLIPDPDKIIDGFHEEFDEFMGLARQVGET